MKTRLEAIAMVAKFLFDYDMQNFSALQDATKERLLNAYGDEFAVDVDNALATIR